MNPEVLAGGDSLRHPFERGSYAAATLRAPVAYGFPLASSAVCWSRPKTSICFPVQTLARALNSGLIGAAGRRFQLPPAAEPPKAAVGSARTTNASARYLFMAAASARAATAAALAFLAPGETIALAEGAYFGTSLTFRELERWGLRLVEFDQTGPPPEGVDLVWLEAPSNPFLTMPDLGAAVAHPAPVVVDATAATPIQLRPLEHGADFVLHSATKYLA